MSSREGFETVGPQRSVVDVNALWHRQRAGEGLVASAGDPAAKHVLAFFARLPVPAIAPYIVPLSVIVLVGVFGLRPQGSARIGRLFGPIMAIWFITIGVLGIGGLLQYPSTLMALDPR